VVEGGVWFGFVVLHGGGCFVLFCFGLVVLGGFFCVLFVGGGVGFVLGGLCFFGKCCYGGDE